MRNGEKENSLPTPSGPRCLFIYIPPHLTWIQHNIRLIIVIIVKIAIIVRMLLILRTFIIVRKVVIVIIVLIVRIAIIVRVVLMVRIAIIVRIVIKFIKFVIVIIVTVPVYHPNNSFHLEAYKTKKIPKKI